MLFPITKKQQLAYLLTAFLDRGRTYTERQLNHFVRDSISARLTQDARFDVDHLRVAMVENGYVERTADGSQYRVSPEYLSVDELLPEIARKAAGNEADAPCICPLCRDPVKTKSLLTHCRKYHDPTANWDDLIEQFGS